MSDPAYRATETIIKHIERRLAKEYAKAVKEIGEKLDDYMSRYYKKDKTWKEWVDSVKKTDPVEYKNRKAEYMKWRTGQIAVGKRWRDMRQTLAEDYHKANITAREIAKGEMPEIYAINHNYGTFEVEKGAKLDTSYTLYDKNTVIRIMRDNPKLLPDPGKAANKRIYNALDVRWNRQTIQSVMMQSLIQGESIPKIAKRLSEAVGDKNYKAAIRNARTMATGAQNAGRVDSYKRAQAMGINMEQMWLATHDNRTRHTHRLVDYEVQPVGHKFSNGCYFPGDPDGPGREIYNCFVGYVNVATDSDIVRSYKHRYKGELVTVKTAGGVCFACTLNHPILTDRGWVGAQFLNEGDNLIVTLISDKHFPGRYPNINHVFTRFDTLHKFLDVVGGQRTCALGVNFHGDIATSDVQVITQKRFLGNNGYIGKIKKHNKLFFKNSYALASGFCHTIECFRRICETALCLMRRFRKSLSFFWGGMGHSSVHSFGTVTDRNIVLPKYSINNLPTDTIIRSELLNGISGKVFLDKIISIKRSVSNCHVYNLQTESGYYFVNSSISKIEHMFNGNVAAIAKNCRCTLRGLVEGLEPQARKYRDLSDIGGDYEAWKNSKEKPQSNPITLPEEKEKAIRNAYIAEYRRKTNSIKGSKKR